MERLHNLRGTKIKAIWGLVLMVKMNSSNRAFHLARLMGYLAYIWKV